MNSRGLRPRGQGKDTTAVALDVVESNVAADDKYLEQLHIEDHDRVAIFTVRPMTDGRQFYNGVTLEDEQRKTPVVSPRDTPIAGERATSANTGVQVRVRRDLDRVNPATVSKFIDPDTVERVLLGRHDAQSTAWCIPRQSADADVGIDRISFRRARVLRMTTCRANSGWRDSRAPETLRGHARRGCPSSPSRGPTSIQP